MSTKLIRIAELARADRGLKFLSLAHLLDEESLLRAFENLRKDASAGIDGVTYRQYETNAVRNIQALQHRLRKHQYRAQPLRRVYIEKEDGKQRPLSIPSLEDKIVQKATLDILNAVYEQDFLECSYGFRPGRGAQDALSQVGRVICRGQVSCVLEADIQGYFDSIVRGQLIEMIKERVVDGNILRLIGKWINVGVIEDGRLLVTKTGTGQGQVISPLLANIYLHHVLDAWWEKMVKPRMRGEVHLIRYADDFVICFQYREDAQKVLEVLPKRFAKYGLTLHPEKTRLIDFGPAVLRDSEKQGKGAPPTFDFLGFTHVCARSRRGYFTVHVRTMRKRMKRSLVRVAVWCREHMHAPVEKQRQALNRKLRGHYEYYGRPTNYRSLWRYFRVVRCIWRKWLNRRTRGRPLTWLKFEQLLRRHPLIRPYIAHPLPA